MKDTISCTINDRELVKEEMDLTFTPNSLIAEFQGDYDSRKVKVVPGGDEHQVSAHKLEEWIEQGVIEEKEDNVDDPENI